MILKNVGYKLEDIKVWWAPISLHLIERSSPTITYQILVEPMIDRIENIRGSPLHQTSEALN
jgi:hypothetical protein